MTELDLPGRSESDDLEGLLRGFLRSSSDSRPKRNTSEARARDLGIPLDWVPGREGRVSAGRAQHHGLAWLHWCARTVPVLQAQPYHVEQWLHALAQAGYTNTTRGRMLSSVSAFYRYLLRSDIRMTTANPADPAVIDRRAHHLNKGAQEPAATTALDLAQSRALLQAAWLLASHNPHGRRDRAMVELLVTTGIREDELVSVNSGDYHRPHPAGSGTLRVHGKGDKDRLVLLTEPVCDVLDDYLAVRTPPEVPARVGQIHAAPREPLFATDRGRQVHSSHVHRMLRRICRAFDPDHPAHQHWLRDLRATARGTELGRVLGPLANTLHPHQLRHSYATQADERGVEPRQTQRDLDHSSLSTTLGYIDNTRGVQDSAAAELSPALHRGWLPPRSSATPASGHHPEHRH